MTQIVNSFSDQAARRKGKRTGKCPQKCGPVTILKPNKLGLQIVAVIPPHKLRYRTP